MMKPRSRRALPTLVFLLMLVVLAPSIVLWSGAGNTELAPDSTGTLAGANEANLAAELAPHTAEPYETATLPSVPNKPKPDETGVPTPVPTWILPPMTPIPTNANPDIWRNCPAFQAGEVYRTPAPGESTICPTPVPTYIQPTPAPNDPVRVDVFCGTPDPPGDTGTVGRETRGSEVVVIGTVQHVQPARWTTADGRRPANPYAQDPIDPQFHSIVTPVEIAVEQYLKGSGPQSRLWLWSVGGTVGRDVVDGCRSMYSFEPGQRVVVFLQARRQAPSDEFIFDLVARYTVVANNEATAEYRSIPLPQLLERIRTAAGS